MTITRTSQISNITRSLELDITQEQWDRYLKGNENIQQIFPNLTAGEREFILTGITDEEWDKAFPDDDNGPDNEHEDYGQDPFHYLGLRE